MSYQQLCDCSTRSFEPYIFNDLSNLYNKSKTSFQSLVCPNCPICPICPKDLTQKVSQLEAEIARLKNRPTCPPQRICQKPITIDKRTSAIIPERRISYNTMEYPMEYPMEYNMDYPMKSPKLNFNDDFIGSLLDSYMKYYYTYKSKYYSNDDYQNLIKIIKADFPNEITEIEQKYFSKGGTQHDSEESKADMIKNILLKDYKILYNYIDITLRNDIRPLLDRKYLESRDLLNCLGDDNISDCEKSIIDKYKTRTHDSLNSPRDYNLDPRNFRPSFDSVTYY